MSLFLKWRWAVVPTTQGCARIKQVNMREVLRIEPGKQKTLYMLAIVIIVMFLRYSAETFYFT